jgi:hypothetical protein
MKPGYICVAGIDPETGKHIRPVLNHDRLSRNLLRKEGGVFEIGAIVEIGPTKNVGNAPEMEDHEFLPENLKHVRRLKPDDFWEWLIKTSEDKLKSIFGDDLEQRNNSCTLEVGSGIASLGNLAPEAIPYFGVDGWGKIRIDLSNGELHPNLSVTDIRLYKSDQTTAKRKTVESVAARLTKTETILAVGVGRAWKRNGDTVKRHWLQVNNIHLEEDPLGEIFNF